MTHTSTKKRSDTMHRVSEKALDVAIGGTALAAEKAAETFDKAAGKAAKAFDKAVDRADEAIQQGRREVSDKVSSAKSAAHKAVGGKDARPYEDRTRDDLYSLAAEREIEGRSSMRKDELIAALRAER